MMSEAKANEAQAPAIPAADPCDGLPPIFREAIDPDASTLGYDLSRPWVAHGWVNAAEGHLAVRVPVASIPPDVAARYDRPPAEGKRRPDVGSLFTTGIVYDPVPVALPPVPSDTRPCPDCKGVPGVTVECDECEGTGKAACYECEGTGKVECEYGHEHECPDCEGDDGEQDCEDCEGSGKQSCDECDGTGRVPDRRAVAIRSADDPAGGPYYLAAWLVARLRRSGIAAVRLPDARSGGSMWNHSAATFAFDAARPGDGLGQGLVMPMTPGAVGHSRDMGDEADYPMDELAPASPAAPEATHHANH